MLTITDAGINVQITRETRSPSQQDFGILMFLIPDADVGDPGHDRVQSYTSMAGIADDWDAADAAYKAALAYYSQSPSPIDFKIGRYDPNLDIQDELDAILSVDSKFFCVVADATLRDVAEITDIGSWCQANSRVQFATSNDANCKDANNTTNIMYLAKQAGLSNTTITYSSTAAEYPDCSAFAIMATTSYRGKDTVKTLKFKDLPGITVETLDAGDLLGIKAHNGNVFYETASIRMYDEGKCADGSWIDEVVGTYALAEELRVRVFGLLSRTKTKVPYTEPGMAQVKAEVEAGLLQYVSNGFLADGIDENGDVDPAYTISSLPVSGASQSDKANRIAPDVQFTGRLASAWHKGTISGNLVL